MRTEFTDGTILRWFPEKRCKGARCGKMCCEMCIRDRHRTYRQ